MRDKERMNPILHLNSNQKRLELNRSTQHRKNYNRDKRILTRRNHLPAGRSEITSLYSQGKPTAVPEQYSMDAPESIPWRERLVQRSASAQGNESSEPGNVGYEKLVCRFLSWCFPPREFSSPLQRLLYLSMEGPKPKGWSRLLFR
jgi:hypothetical protein